MHIICYTQVLDDATDKLRRILCGKKSESDFRDKICSRESRVADKDGIILFDCYDFKISGERYAKAKVEVRKFRE